MISRYFNKDNRAVDLILKHSRLKA